MLEKLFEPKDEEQPPLNTSNISFCFRDVNMIWPFSTASPPSAGLTSYDTHDTSTRQINSHLGKSRSNYLLTQLAESPSKIRNVQKNNNIYAWENSDVQYKQ